MCISIVSMKVKNLRDPRYSDLVGRGMKLFVCAYGCQQHGVSTDQLDPSFPVRVGGALKYCKRLRPFPRVHVTTFLRI